MKRHPDLHPLSDDHHTALVLARRLRRTPTPPDAEAVSTLAEDVRNRFRTELEPHFEVEERWLFPQLEAKGAGELARQARDDHARLRRLVFGAWSPATPAEIGRLLEKHVRFEERSLFPAAEEMLSAAELDGIRDATLAARDRANP